jgi:dTDP-4-dehydrorhamnose 3,5-epimerase
MSALTVEATALPDVKLVTPRKFEDQRGFFSEVYNKRSFAEAGLDFDFVQDNHSLSGPAGTIRGLHYQTEPHGQVKLVRVVRGRILDVAVDLRRSSPTYARHVAVELSAENWRQLLIPIGFAHGFCTLEPDTEVIYKVTDFYSPMHDSGVRWNDPALDIKWPVAPDRAMLSDKDTKLPLLKDAPDGFK